MTNTNKSDPRARLNNQPGRILYEVGTLDGGTIVIKQVVVPGENLPAAEKAKDVKASNARVTG